MNEKPILFTLQAKREFIDNVTKRYSTGYGYRYNKKRNKFKYLNLMQENVDKMNEELLFAKLIISAFKRNMILYTKSGKPYIYITESIEGEIVTKKILEKHCNHVCSLACTFRIGLDLEGIPLNTIDIVCVQTCIFTLLGMTADDISIASLHEVGHIESQDLNLTGIESEFAADEYVIGDYSIDEIIETLNKIIDGIEPYAIRTGEEGEIRRQITPRIEHLKNLKGEVNN